MKEVKNDEYSHSKRQMEERVLRCSMCNKVEVKMIHASCEHLYTNCSTCVSFDHGLEEFNRRIKNYKEENDINISFYGVVDIDKMGGGIEYCIRYNSCRHSDFFDIRDILSNIHMDSYRTQTVRSIFRCLSCNFYRPQTPEMYHYQVATVPDMTSPSGELPLTNLYGLVNDDDAGDGGGGGAAGDGDRESDGGGGNDNDNGDDDGKYNIKYYRRICKKFRILVKITSCQIIGKHITVRITCPFCRNNRRVRWSDIMFKINSINDKDKASVYCRKCSRSVSGLGMITPEKYDQIIKEGLSDDV